MHVPKRFYFPIPTGEPGVPGERGPAGPQGLKGIQGESGNVGVSYVRWGKKTCPNTGATLVYEGNDETVFCHKQALLCKFVPFL